MWRHGVALSIEYSDLRVAPGGRGCPAAPGHTDGLSSMRPTNDLQSDIFRLLDPGRGEGVPDRRGGRGSYLALELARAGGACPYQTTDRWDTTVVHPCPATRVERPVGVDLRCSRVPSPDRDCRPSSSAWGAHPFARNGGPRPTPRL